jgi:hypothetical protein
VEEGTRQLDSLLYDIDEQLRLLNHQQQEQDEEVRANNNAVKLIDNDAKDKKQSIEHVAITASIREKDKTGDKPLKNNGSKHVPNNVKSNS